MFLCCCAKNKKEKSCYELRKLDNITLDDAINKIFTPWFIKIIDFGAQQSYPILMFEITPLREMFIINYIDELFSETDFSQNIPQLIVITIIYINRLKLSIRSKYKIQRIFTFSNFTGIFIIALLLASKFILDNPPTNSEIKDYAFGDNINLQAFNMLESLFLNTIDFNLFVSPEEYYIWLTFIHIK
jgi:hypothetical protein